MQQKTLKKFAYVKKTQYFCSELTQTPINMKRAFLPQGIGIAITKSQFCFSTGCSPYKLKCTIEKRKDKYRRLGLGKYDKLLMPSVVQELLSDTGLRIDMQYYIQYLKGKKGEVTPLEIIETE